MGNGGEEGYGWEETFSRQVSVLKELPESSTATLVNIIPQNCVGTSERWRNESNNSHETEME